MTTKTSSRLRFKQAMTATAFAIVQCRNVWRTYFQGLSAERKAAAERQQRGWGG